MKEKCKFSDVFIKVMGYTNADELKNILLSSDIYIHTAYIDNSPNSICEAQYLGLPLIATYVGGVPSIVENGKEGLLVPANAPFTLASEIIKLSKDIERQKMYSEATRKKARERHKPETILNDLINCYKTLLTK